MHKLSVNGEKPFNAKEYYEKGETVKLSFLSATDSRIEIRTDDVSGKKEYGDGEISYSLIMPDHDVDVSVTYINDMVNTHNTSSMGNSQVNPFVKFPFFNKDKSKDFCPECGMKKAKNRKYCPACEERLSIKK